MTPSASPPSIRIVLAGDDGCGKSTLLTSLIKEAYVPNVQNVVPEISLPPEVSPEGCLTKIVDTSAAPEARARGHLESELRRASVICLVYSVSAPTSFDRIPTYWLPLIRSLGVNVPVILVGNKIDLRSGEATEAALEQELTPVMAEFKEVESCVECSAKLPLNVSEVFYFAQKAVLYPTAPLYDARERCLKPACVEALRRIFRLCDADKDGLLNDAELNDFQRKCFDAPLQSQELEGIKDLVSSAPYDAAVAADSTTASSSADGGSASRTNHPHLRNSSLTLSGFLYLHTLFVQRGRLETTWMVLRTFGYGPDLTLKDAFIRPPFSVPAECSVELSPHGYQFLTDVFEVHDKDRDGALSSSELASLFSTVPEASASKGPHPWSDDENFPETTVTDENGNITLQGWLAQWSMTTLLDHRTTLEYLAYLGYPAFVTTDHPGASTGSLKPIPIGGGRGAGGRNKSDVAKHPLPTTTALKVTKPRRVDRKKKGRVQRGVLLAYVVGAAGCGKTSILRYLVGKRWEDAYTPTARVLSVVSAVEQGGAEKYLVLQEFGSRYEAEALRNPSKLASADVIIYAYDSSDTNSFSYISNLRQQYPLLSTLPSLFVATKADLDLAQQRHEVQPDVYCRKLGLRIPFLPNNGAGPISVSARSGEMADLWNVLCSVALDPRGATPGGAGARQGKLPLIGRMASGAEGGWIVAVLAIALVGGGVAFVGFRRNANQGGAGNAGVWSWIGFGSPGGGSAAGGVGVGVGVGGGAQTVGGVGILGRLKGAFKAEL